MKKILLITILIIPIKFFSCKDENGTIVPYEPVVIDCKLSKDLDTAKMYITGDWIWLQEERRQRGKPTEYLTPINQDYTRELIIAGDTAIFYKNDIIETLYQFSITKLYEITGTNFPEDEDPIIIFNDTETGERVSYVPIEICANYLVLQGQYVTSLGGEETWKRK